MDNISSYIVYSMYICMYVVFTALSILLLFKDDQHNLYIIILFI